MRKLSPILLLLPIAAAGQTALKQISLPAPPYTTETTLFPITAPVFSSITTLTAGSQTLTFS